MRWILTKTLWFGLLLSFTTQSSANSEGIEISGLVIDRTLTRFGKDFNFYYSSYWRDLPYTQGYNVTLTETVFPQAGTLLLLEINGKAIYRTHFGRRMSPVEERAKEAMLLTLDYIAKVRANEMTGDASLQLDGF
ncbi:curli production assembly protein CsgE [Parashewanella spongiae]|uniref:Curli production assembly/transport component CsgE n=2 Tax=Parashewanella spongiae TaxID=342950 RepID=A0A3A6U6J0_9GAMM|nr:curli production assembly/transport protein CsgE [Parashewanella spongiae]MCL1078736.1 curli production assembly/transport protein CsgE [Parashewanella spongiae]RJY17498.1 curli production assembly protein CsgE [Parashewanella spongiae]